jgi:DNA-binding response OmpR family regulator
MSAITYASAISRDVLSSSCSCGFGRGDILRKILVVDDDSTLVKLIAMALEVNGYASATAGDGEKGLKLARDESPDLILLDIMMPVMDGLTMLEELRKTSDVPVIIISAYGNSERVDKARELGVECFVNKPFGFEALIDMVELVLKEESPESAQPSGELEA